MTPTRRQALIGGAALAAAPGLAAPPRSPFLWGVATAAHVSEGQNVNSDYWVVEHIPSTFYREPSGDANDAWHRWREDLLLARSAGLNAFRFSIEWARIEPAPGEFSAAALAHYRRICEAARELGLEPVVTFHHFTSPRWIAAQGGWEAPATAERFARYCAVAARALAGAARWICTTNEANGPCVTKALNRGNPWDKLPVIQAEAAHAIGADRFSAFNCGDPYRMRDTFLAAHRRGRAAIKDAIPNAKVGMALDLQELRVAPGGEELAAQVGRESRAPFYEAARGDDFIGVQSYHVLDVGPQGRQESVKPAWADAWGRDCAPTVLANVAREVHREAGVPVFVTEHGINTTDDALRIRHTRASVAALGDAVAGGLPVLGYCHFTLVDTWEWSSGYVPKFGMAGCDRATFERTPRPSLAAYRRLIADTRRQHRWA